MADFSFLAQGVQAPQIVDPMTQVAKVMSLAQLASNRQMDQYNLQKAQRADQSANALNQALGQINFDDAASVKNAIQQFPEAASPILKTYEDYQKNKADTGYKQAQTDNQATETQQKKLVMAGGLAADAAKMGTDPQRVMQSAQAMGLDPQMFAVPEGVDPRQHYASLANGTIAAAKQADIANTQAGQGITMRGQDMTAATAKAGQGVTMRGQNMVDSREQQRIALEKQKADPMGALGGSPAGQAAMGDVHGDDFLKTLPGPIADQVKALAEGRMAFPGSFALKSPYWQQMISAVGQYDPTFDAINYNARSSTRKDFTSGKSSQSLNALNTVMGHLDELEKASSALDNTRFPLVNSVINGVRQQTGDPRIQTFKTVQGAVSKELERAYRGTGGTQSDIDAMKEDLNANSSPEALKAVVQKYVTLLGSKIDAMGEQYDKGMGTTSGGLKLLNPKAQETYNRLNGEAEAPKTDTSRDDLVKQAMDAISRGAPRDKVLERLRAKGVTDARI